MDIKPPRSATPRQPDYRNPGLQVGARHRTHSPFLSGGDGVALQQPPVAKKTAEPTVKQTQHLGVKKAEIIKKQQSPQSTVAVRRRGKRALKSSAVHKIITPQLTTKALTNAKQQKKSSRSSTLFSKIGYGFASIVFLFGAGVALQGLLLNKSVETQVHAVEAKSKDDVVVIPTNEKPKDKNFIANHAVAPLAPRTISVPSLRVNARVVPMGIDKDGSVQAPKTSYDTGWYSASSRPGEMGAMLIDGHVMGDGNAPGIFSKLKTLGAGSEVVVERGDKKQFTYVVTKVETVKVADVNMGKMLVSSNTAKPGLTLITCGGTMDRKNLTFDSRTIVYAIQK